MTAAELRSTLAAEAVDAQLWLANDRQARREHSTLLIDEAGYCRGVLNAGQPVQDYYEQIQGARAALDILGL